MSVRNIVLIICFGVFSTNSFAQNSRYQFRGEFYKHINPFSFANETTNGFHYPNNLGFAVGIERDYKNKKRIRTYQTATIGFFNEVYFERAVTLESKYGLSFKLVKGLNLGFETGLGYQRGQSSNLVSVFQDNKWVSKVDKSVVTNRITPEVSVNMGYDFSKHFGGKLPISISASLSANVLYPYLKQQGAPIGINRRNNLILKYRF
jgi:hypothetical protein